MDKVTKLNAGLTSMSEHHLHYTNGPAYLVADFVAIQTFDYSCICISLYQTNNKSTSKLGRLFK